MSNSSSVYRVSLDEGDYQIYLPNAEQDYIQKYIADNASPYELEMLRDMASRLSEGDLVIDVGANVGNHSTYLANIASVRVLAFEPSPHLSDAIALTADLNGNKESISVYNFGLGELNALGSFDNLNPENLGAQKLKLGSGDIKVRTLDSLTDIDSVSMIKVDVEGMELAVLKGARQLLKRCKPYCYIESSNVDDFRNIAHFLAELGYYAIDSFNATPTHLFIHKSNLASADVELAHQHYMEEADFNLPQEIKKTKEKLHSANLKYRNICGVVDTLKEQLATAKSSNTTLKIDSNQLLKSLNSITQDVRELSNSSANNEQILRLLNSLIDGVSGLKKSSLSKESKLENILNSKDFFTGALESLENNSEIKKAELIKNSALLNTQINEQQEYSVKIESRLGEFEKSFHNIIDKLEDIDALKILLSNQQSITQEITSQKLASDKKLTEALTEQKELLKRVNRQDQENSDLRSDLEFATQHLSELNKQLTISRNDAEKGHSIAVKANLEKEKIMNNKNDLEKELQALRSQLDKLTEELHSNNQKLSIAELDKLKAFAQVDEIRASVMFQLGNALVNSVLSFRGFVSLPGRLFSIFCLGLKKVNFLKPKASNNINKVPKLKPPQKLLDDTVSEFSLPKELDSFSNSSLSFNTVMSERKVACIMDEFTYSSYAPTCKLNQLTPDNWQIELEQFEPELLFIESAWRGKDELWGSKVGHNSKELQSIIQWCKSRNIPTVFWNKEDPIHYQTFLNVAKQFDYVFTTDLDCISRYKAALNHNNVFFLPFACQPLVHNPVEKFERKDAVSFAGAYYKKYPERTKDLEGFVGTLPDVCTLNIFDRNYGKTDENYMFPDVYKAFIVGTLPFEKIDVAYKGYKYAINLNSIKQSQTMFARRVYELLASNTLTISNFSKGIRLMFGDLILCSDSSKVIKASLEKCIDDREFSDKLRLAGTRKAIKEHTYQQRFSYIEEKVFGKKESLVEPSLSIISFADNEGDLGRIVNSFNLQKHETKKLFIFTKGIKTDLEIYNSESVHVLNYSDYKSSSIISIIGETDYIALWSANDYYGPNYSTDCLLHFSYLITDVVGKKEKYAFTSSQEIEHLHPHLSYQETKGLTYNASLLRADIINSNTVKTLRKLINKEVDSSLRQFAGDRFNYCANGKSDLTAVETRVNDIQGLNVGKSLYELQKVAELSQPMSSNAVEKLLPIELLSGVFSQAKASKVQLCFENTNIRLSSSLLDGKHEYLYGTKLINIEEFNPQVLGASQQIKLFIDASPGLNASFVLIYLDENEQRLSHHIIPTNQNKVLEIPLATKLVKVGFRALSAGECEIKGVTLGERNLMPTKILSNSKTLLITNNYPSYHDLYRNGFVHSRILAYKKQGVVVDVFRCQKETSLDYQEFEGVDVITGNTDVLHKLVEENKYENIFVHFLDADTWEVLSSIREDIRLNIWLHGADIQPWWRRKCIYDSDMKQQMAAKTSELKLEFWRSVFKSERQNTHFIFVSNYLAQTAMEDLGIKLPEEKYSIIPNGIDHHVFSYHKKQPELRKKILSIRPYASKIYANDLLVNAILTLSEEPFFKDLSFTIVGDGPLFDDITLPIRKFDNVRLEKRFLTRKEISKYHKQHGVFLCPSRMDTQGVSRDEAVSSGLIPVTSSVAAIPEFVSEEFGFMAPFDDYLNLASAIKVLYKDADLYIRMQERLMDSISNRTSNLVASKELSLIK